MHRQAIFLRQTDRLWNMHGDGAEEGGVVERQVGRDFVIEIYFKLINTAWSKFL